MSDYHVTLPNGKLSNSFEAALAWKSRAESLLTDRGALVRYVRARKEERELYDDRYSGPNAFEWWEKADKKAKDAYEALSQELRNEIGQS